MLCSLVKADVAGGLASHGDTAQLFHISSEGVHLVCRQVAVFVDTLRQHVQNIEMWVVPAGTAGRGEVKPHMKVDTGT